MSIFLRSLFTSCLLLMAATSWAQPTANFTATPLVGCAPLLVQFTSTSTGSPTTYSWNLGNSATSVLQNPSTTYTIPGTYTVTLTVTNASGTNTKTETNYITVYGKPIVDFSTPDTAGCPPHTATFVNNTTPVTPGAATYTWSFGDGYNSTQAAPTHTYTASGYYNVTLVATNSGGCNASLTKAGYIHVLTPPVGNFTASQTSFCDVPATTTFAPTIVGTAPYTYAWNFGNSTTGTGGNPSATYTNQGTYTVTMTVTDARGCKDTVTKPNYISAGSLVAWFTMSGTSGCVNTPFTFTSTSVGATSYTWLFGDGNTQTSTNNSTSYVYTTAGVYNVSLIAINGTCSDTLTIPLTIHPQPDANFTSSPAAPCPAPAVVNFTNTTVGGSTYTWDFGNASTSTLTNPSTTYNANGWYDVTLIATSSFGCKDTIVKPDSVRVYNLILDAGAVPYQGCAPLEVNFSAVTYTSFPSSGSLYPWGTATYSWDLGNGQTSTSATPVTTYNTPGTYQIYLTITTVNGCTMVDSLQVLVGPHPTASFTAAPTVICNHGTVVFTNNSTGATSYIWDFGDGGATGATNPSHTYTTSGTMTVILHAYNNGCEDTFMMQNLITVHPPTSKWYAVYDCDTPRMVKFIDTATIGATSRLWWFGDGQTSTATSPVHFYANPGLYNVSLITYNNVYGCTDTMTQAIEIFDPVLSFSANDTAVCLGETFQLTGSSNSPVLEWTWRVSPFMLFDTLASINFTYNSTGIYDVWLIAQDPHLCYDTLKKLNYMHVSKPDAAFTASPLVGCTPLNVTFTDQSTGIPGTTMVSRNWDFGNGNTTTVAGATASSVYPNAGLYDITLIVTDNVGCKDTLVKNDYVDARSPVASFTVNDTAACIGQNLSFNNTSVGTTLSASWDFGDNTTSNLFSPSHAYAATGSYTIRLIVTDPSGCKDTLIKTAHVVISKPNASFTMDDTLAICPPLNVLFTNTSTGATNYLWTFGNSSTSSIPSPSAIYTTPGIFSISMVAISSEGCTDTAYASATVLGYAGGLSYTPLSGCSPLEVSFTANLQNVPSIVWDFSDGTTTPANGSSTITHTYVTPGAYIPKLILSDGAGCLNSSDGIDTIKVDGILSGFVSTPACEKTMVEFTDTSFSFFSPVTSWLWNVNNGQQTSSSNTVSYLYNAPGSYPVSLIVTNANGCKDTVVRNVVIHPLPTIGAGQDTSVCLTDAAVLTGTGGVSYTWAPATSLSCSTCVTTNASPNITTIYTVTGTDANGCVSTDQVEVTIQLITTSVAAPGGQICDDSTFQLMVSGAERYEWKPSATLTDGNIADPIASPHATTVYTVTAWEGSCPPDSHKVEVVVWPKPVIYAGADETIISGGSVMLNATGSNLASFVWSPVATLSCETCSNPVAMPPATTQYKVMAISSHGCKASDSLIVNVICDQSQLFIPNLFSPNGDGQNDVFYPRGQGLKEIRSFRIYNRWGEVVFESRSMGLNDPAAGWDGSYKGAALGPDVFVYVIDGVCESGEAISWKGDITLVR
ncbi:MAG: PKD domain-containing protein [Sphingobacteriales bacterium]|nr:MAG: PKD domain-containing protein [Sphingobacteriales bacterium]